MSLEAWGDTDEDGFDDVRDQHEKHLLEEGWLDREEGNKLAEELHAARIGIFLISAFTLLTITIGGTWVYNRGYEQGLASCPSQSELGAKIEQLDKETLELIHKAKEIECAFAARAVGMAK